MNNKYLIIIIIISLASSFALAADVSKENNFDLKLAIRYPILINKKSSNTDSDVTKYSFKNETKTTKEFKSKGKAFLYSLLMPGAGEYYIGNKTLAKTFFITELVLWTGYFSFRAYSDWKRDDMYIFAATHADANIEDKQPQYFVDLGNYNDIYQYNDSKQRRGEFFKVYSEEEYYWYWDSAENRNKFEQMRISSDRAHNRSIFTVGGIIANHIISAIDAVWQSYIYNKRLIKKAKFDNVKIHLGAKPAGDFLITIQKNF